MKLFFWQNISSIHQSAFFRALVALEKIEVTLIVTEKISEVRLGMGWDIPEIKELNIIDISGDENSVYKDLINFNSDDKSLHIFSGINAFPIVHKAFLYALKKQCKVGIFTEPLDFRGLKGFFRNVRGHYYSFIFRKKIDLILVTGKYGYKQFKNWGYHDYKIFEWAYTVEKLKLSIDESLESKSSVFNIMFAGSLIPRKGYDILINALKMNRDEGMKFNADFYCLHQNEIDKGKRIEQEQKLGKEIKLLPFLPNKELRLRMGEYDLFVLPSRHDGWGAVINESLAAGTPTIVSSKCGSSTLITGSFTGNKIEFLNDTQLAEVLKARINKGKLSFNDRLYLQNWYDNSISGDAMAKYLIDILHFINHDKRNSKPIVPWER